MNCYVCTEYRHPVLYYLKFPCMSYILAIEEIDHRHNAKSRKCQIGFDSKGKFPANLVCFVIDNSIWEGVHYGVQGFNVNCNSSLVSTGIMIALQYPTLKYSLFWYFILFDSIIITGFIWFNFKLNPESPCSGIEIMQNGNVSWYDIFTFVPYLFTKHPVLELI